MKEMSNTVICLPGQRLVKKAENDKYQSGYGTYEREGYIYSMLAGVLDIIERDSVKVLEVRSPMSQTIVPVQGDIVTAEVKLCTQQYCKCLIKSIGNKVLSRPLRAVLKKEEIRATEKDRIHIRNCYRPKDIILARVLPITEPQNYQLTTAEVELGVVYANSEEGHLMVPKSWNVMQCTKTFAEEPRKVAKIVPGNILEEMDVDGNK